MRKISYNISSGKIIDRKHLMISMFIIIFSSIIFVFFGIKNISDTNYNLKEKIDQRKLYEMEKEKIADKEKIFKNKISKIKSEWNQRVSFANDVIRVKVFPFIKQLEYFEEILPEMIQINDISIDSGTKGNVTCTVSSFSTKNLYDLYTKLIDNNLTILSESEKNGVYRSKLRVTIKK